MVELSNERLPFFFQLFDFLLQLRGLLLLVLQRLDQLVPLVEHGDHQLLEVGVVAELRRPLRDRVLGDGRHHVAHHVPHLGRLIRSGSAETRSLERDEKDITNDLFHFQTWLFFQNSSIRLRPAALETFETARCRRSHSGVDTKEKSGLLLTHTH